MQRVRKISHATFESKDLASQAEYYTEVLGLTETGRDGGAVYLASVLDHHSVVLKQGSEARCTTLAFQVVPGELDAFKAQVEGKGVKVETASDAQPGVDRLIRFTDLKGTMMEVFEIPAVAAQSYSGKGIEPFKLGHVAFHTDDIHRDVGFFRDVMGFRESDWMGDFFAFMRCGPDHHTVNLINTGKKAMHHIAFELKNWDHVQRASDYLTNRGIKLIWGPGRHGIGHNIFTYHFNPEEQIVELFTELDQINDEELGFFEPRPWHAERPLKPKHWAPGPGSANVWGIMPPDWFLH